MFLITRGRNDKALFSAWKTSVKVLRVAGKPLNRMAHFAAIPDDLAKNRVPA